MRCAGKHLAEEASAKPPLDGCPTVPTHDRWPPMLHGPRTLGENALTMPARSRLIAAIALLALSTALASSAQAGASASIEQVRNGQATATTTPTPSWVTGNAGGSNSHYLESHSIAYRTIMTGLPTNGQVIKLTVGYNVKRSGAYAIDFLTQYQRLLPHVLFGHRLPEAFDPLNGITGVDTAVTTAPLPAPTRNIVGDPGGAGPGPAAAQPATTPSRLPAARPGVTPFGGHTIAATSGTAED